MINRIKLAEYFGELGFKVGAEVGVAHGYYSEVLCQSIPGLKLFCVDSWVGYEGYDTRYERYEQLFKDATEKLSKYGCILIRKTSMEAVKDFEDESLDFVYIDANHDYLHVVEDIREWTKKVRKGGIVSGHDYYTSKNDKVKVKHAVNEYVAEHGYTLQLTDWRRHLEMKDNQQPSWYFVKDK